MDEIPSDRERVEARESYVDEIMRREAEEVAARPSPTRPRSWVPVLVPLLVILAGLLGWNIHRAVRELEVFTPEEEHAAELFTIYLVQQAIESYRDSTGSLPQNLAVLGAEDEGVNYVVNDTAYALRINESSAPISYRSGQDVSPFEAAYERLMREVNR